MSTTDPRSGATRLDVNDPADAQQLVNAGLAWRSGPKTLQVIFNHIREGAVTRVPEKETPEVRAYLDKVAPVAPVEPPVADVPLDAEQGPPVEQPGA